MAYNNNWEDNSNWNNYKHPRDEEYANDDGKRRKYNDGGYDPAQPYQEEYQEYNCAGNAGFKQREGGHRRSEPSSHVIFLGLDNDYTEADLKNYLSTNGHEVEATTIIRDRGTGTSKGFGFAHFANTEQASAFLEPTFPFIQVPPPSSHGPAAQIAFFQALEAGTATGRRVKIDYSQSQQPNDKRPRTNLNDGTRDIGSAPGPVLLFRGLDPLSGPQAIAQAMFNSSGPGKEGAKGMKRIVLIKEKLTMTSYCFGFVEFVDKESASAVLGATMSQQIHPAGFRISDVPVAASFAHPYSFQPATDPALQDEACIASSLAMGGLVGAWVRYWDETSTVAVLEYDVEIPIPVAVLTKKEKKKKDLVVKPAPPAAKPSALPISDKPMTLSFGKGIKLAPRIVAPVTLGFSMDDTPPDEDENVGETSVTEETSKFVAAQKVPPLIASKKTVSAINKWNQVQKELTHDTPAAAVPIGIPAPIPPPTTPAYTASVALVAVKTAPTPAAEDEFDFSNKETKTCLLCSRKFKTIEQLSRHNKESDLHKKNYQDDAVREAARIKVGALKQSTPPATTEQKYRDRASERRVMHNQPDVPMPQVEGDKDKDKGKKRAAPGPPPPPPPPPAPVNPGEDKSNVGNKMLKLMGWTEGSGLGTAGEGRVAPIATAMYAQGAGLGASKGKEIEKLPNVGGGYGGYLQAGKDSARERYGS